jgi:hypothetical protein
MSEAGHRRPSRGTSGGPRGRVAGASPMRGCWDLSAEGASGLRRVCSLGGRRVTKVLASGSRARDAENGARERQGVPASQLTGRVRGGQCPCEQAARDTEQPCGAVRMAAAGGAASTASPPRVEQAGNGRSTSPWTVAFWKLGRRLGRKGEAGRGGRQGESPKLGSSVFQRVLVTTSRLQRSVRGILSRVKVGTSVSATGRE